MVFLLRLWALGTIARGFFHHDPAVAGIPRQAADEPIQLSARLQAIQTSQATYLLLADLGASAERTGETQMDLDGTICLTVTVLPGEHIYSIKENHYFVKS
jgi:hypothetical protein